MLRVNKPTSAENKYRKSAENKTHQLKKKTKKLGFGHLFLLYARFLFFDFILRGECCKAQVKEKKKIFDLQSHSLF